MSMLSAQCDELRERAATLRQGRWSDGEDDARLMEDAADTILSLRDRAQDLQAKNAKLREEFDKMDVWHSKELSAAMAENDRLREVVKSMYYDLTNMTFPPDWVTDYAADMRELGIEAGDGVS